ncbi:hypothetical protein SAMN05444321_0380 [Bradyrhizobium lablabi]|nr:hypothetical protein SAMN05444321_0380 [Bradyrhizobium lablabi]
MSRSELERARRSPAACVSSVPKGAPGMMGRTAAGFIFAPEEIDENLIRRDLTPSQRAKLVAKRKAAYEAVYPETKRGAARGNAAARNAKGTSANLAAVSSFARDAASKTGKSKRSIERDATRADALGADLDRVAGTSLDKGAEPDALAAMPAATRGPPAQRGAFHRRRLARRAVLDGTVRLRRDRCQITGEAGQRRRKQSAASPGP